ncbi:hypothetical protein E3N88_13834 [Mikania micrantha]|uniref:Uncharacterized protein n=1 Tax=Mikania micrantha TaxID=192012 RepID=A0A5N6NZQ6_9ASTR|nr:hypothetical protein E3N88_13834 [Mikania micrantha]
MICLRAMDGSSVTIYGDRAMYAPKIISMIKADVMMRRGGVAYLAYVIEERTDMRTIDDVTVVCNFLDVFLEELCDTPAYWALQRPIAVRDGPTRSIITVRDLHRGGLTSGIRRGTRRNFEIPIAQFSTIVGHFQAQDLEIQACYPPRSSKDHRHLLVPIKTLEPGCLEAVLIIFSGF